MRIAILSDIHGNYSALEAVVRDFDRTRPDRIINLGDLIFGGPQPVACLKMLEEIGAVSVRGNTDDFFAPGATLPVPALQPYMDFILRSCGDIDLSALSRLPFSHTEPTPGGDILCFHASPRSNEEYLLPWTEKEVPGILDAVTASTVACGHQRRAYQFRTDSGHLILSTGSVGLPYDGDPRSAYTLVEFNGADLYATSIRIAYDIQETLRAAEAAGHPDVAWLERGLRTGRPPKRS